MSRQKSATSNKESLEEGASGLSRHILSVGAEASGESANQTVSSAANNDDQGTGGEDEMMAMTVSRGRRSAVFLSNSRKPIVGTSYEQDLA